MRYWVSLNFLVYFLSQNLIGYYSKTRDECYLIAGLPNNFPTVDEVHDFIEDDVHVSVTKY